MTPSKKRDRGVVFVAAGWSMAAVIACGSSDPAPLEPPHPPHHAGAAGAPAAAGMGGAMDAGAGGSFTISTIDVTDPKTIADLAVPIAAITLNMDAPVIGPMERLVAGADFVPIGTKVCVPTVNGSCASYGACVEPGDGAPFETSGPMALSGASGVFNFTPDLMNPAYLGVPVTGVDSYDNTDIVPNGQYGIFTMGGTIPAFGVAVQVGQRIRVLTPENTWADFKNGISQITLNQNAPTTITYTPTSGYFQVEIHADSFSGTGDFHMLCTADATTGTLVIPKEAWAPFNADDYNVKNLQYVGRATAIALAYPDGRPVSFAVSSFPLQDTTLVPMSGVVMLAQ